MLISDKSMTQLSGILGSLRTKQMPSMLSSGIKNLKLKIYKLTKRLSRAQLKRDALSYKSSGYK